MTTVSSYNPARPAELLGEFPSADAAAVDAAVRAAAEAQRSWARVPVPLRADVIAEAGRLLAARKDELAALVSREAGKVLIEGGGEVQEAIDMADYAAREALTVAIHEQIYPGILDCSADYAGLSKDADSPLTPEQIEWATEIAVMEPRHQATLRHEFGPHLRQKRVVCLNVPDRFRFMQPELVDLLTERAGRLR